MGWPVALPERRSVYDGRRTGSMGAGVHRKGRATSIFILHSCQVDLFWKANCHTGFEALWSTHVFVVV
jgi:hypothetical protein